MTDYHKDNPLAEFFKLKPEKPPLNSYLVTPLKNFAPLFGEDELTDRAFVLFLTLELQRAFKEDVDIDIPFHIAMTISTSWCKSSDVTLQDVVEGLRLAIAFDDDD